MMCPSRGSSAGSQPSVARLWAFRRADYLPCILWGRTAQDGALLHTRDVIRIRGRLQSRAYTKVTESGTEERIAYEISALTAEIPEDFL